MTSLQRRHHSRPRAPLHGDTRGASLVEYVLLLGLVACVALVAIRVFGASVSAKAEAQARCIDTLRCEETTGQTLGPAAGADAPPPPPATAAATGAVSDGVSAARTPTQAQLARSLVKAGGSGSQSDVDAVAAEVAKMPRAVLEYMQAKGISVVAARGSVTDYMTHLKGVRPRGWPPGSGWDSVPGTVNKSTEVVIATRDGQVPATGNGHGAHSLVIHETFHAIDYAGSWSKADAFGKARDADAANLDAYLKQPGGAGLEEAYAESAAHYFSGDTAWGKKNPHLWAYWETHASKLHKP